MATEPDNQERWEPPRGTPPETNRRKRRRRQGFQAGNLPELWLMVASRLAIVAMLLLSVVVDDIRQQMQVIVLAIMGGLAALVYQADQMKSPRLRNQAVLDLVTLVTVVPLSILASFVAAEQGELLPAEQSTFLELSVAVLIALVFVVLVARYLFAADRALMSVLIVPSLLLLIALVFVLHDFRNQTVLGMLTIAYFIGAAALVLHIVTGESVRKYIPLACYLLTLVAGFVMLDPGLGNLSERESLVQIVTWGMILLGLVLLIILPQRTLDLSVLMSGTASAHGRRRSQRKGMRRDTGRSTEE